MIMTRNKSVKAQPLEEETTLLPESIEPLALETSIKYDCFSLLNLNLSVSFIGRQFKAALRALHLHLHPHHQASAMIVMIAGCFHELEGRLEF
jgi:hypothetical protein